MGNLKESPLTTRRLLRFRHVRLVLVTELLAIERFSLFSSTANVYQLYIYKYASPGSFFFNSHSQLSLSLSSLFVSKSLHQDPPALCIFFTCLKLNHFLYSIDDNPPAYFHLSTWDNFFFHFSFLKKIKLNFCLYYFLGPNCIMAYWSHLCIPICFF